MLLTQFLTTLVCFGIIFMVFFVAHINRAPQKEKEKEREEKAAKSAEMTTVTGMKIRSDQWKALRTRFGR